MKSVFALCLVGFSAYIYAIPAPQATPPPAAPAAVGAMELFSQDNAQGGPICSYTFEQSRQDNLKKTGPCKGKNDEIRSAKFTNIKAGTEVVFFDNPDGKTDDDFITIVFKQDTPTFTLDSLEANIENAAVKATVNRKNGLAGKVSNVNVKVPL